MSVCLQCPPDLSQAGSIVHMSVSFSYKYLAVFTDTGHLWTGSSNLQVSSSYLIVPFKVGGVFSVGMSDRLFCLQEKLSEVDTNQTEAPKQMVWYVCFLAFYLYSVLLT